MSPTAAQETSSRWAGRRVTVMGLGLFGGGVAACRHFAQRGARVTATDLRSAEELRESVQALDDLPITFRLGGHWDEDFRGADLVVASPAVPPDSPYLALARAAGADIETEVGLFLRHCSAPVVGVTGTNGKSTTAALVAEVLRARFGKVWLGGNIGRPLLGEVDSIDPQYRVVLELSSFQLEYLGAAGYSPPIAVVTNLSPNHLDRHGSMANYIAAKQHILAHQGATDVAILNADDPEVRRWSARTPGTSLLFSAQQRVSAGCYLDGDRVVAIHGCVTRTSSKPLRPKLLGEHNVPNVLAALTVGLALGVELDSGMERACRFQGLPHRLELVGEVGGVRFYNDSVATTPESTLAALSAFSEPILLIAGGKDKGIDYTGFAREVARRTRTVVLLGAIAPKLAQLIGDHLPKVGSTTSSIGGPAVHVVESLAEAVAQVRGAARPGDVVLLSPGCSSLDMFRNFEERGKVFRKLVLKPTAR